MVFDVQNLYLFNIAHYNDIALKELATSTIPLNYSAYSTSLLKIPAIETNNWNNYLKGH